MGGDRLSIFNVLLFAVLVLVGCGVQVAKHGNWVVSSTCGSADFFTVLGVMVDVMFVVVEWCLETVGIVFLFVLMFHFSMCHVVQIWRDLGVRTVFNLLGSLINLVGVRC